MDQGESNFRSTYKTCRSHWAQVDPFLLQLFTSRFLKESKVHLNFAFTENNSRILITKQIINKDKKRINSIVSQQQVDLLLPFIPSRYLWMRMTTDQLKLHYHHGKSVVVGPAMLQPYFSFSSTRKFSNSSFKLGAINQFENGFVDCRFRFNIGQHRADSFYYAKYHYNSEKVRVGAIGTVLLKNNQINLQKNDLMAAFSFFKDNWIGVVLQNQQFRKYRINYSRLGSYFDSLKAVYLFDHSNLRLGLLYQYSVEDSTTKKIEAAVEYKSQYHKANFKLKLNTLWKMGVAVEAKFGRWKLQGGTSWQNIINESLKPAQYSFGLSYY